MFDLGTAFRVIEVDTSAIRSREMRDNVHRINTSGFVFRFFNVKEDVKRGEERLNVRFKGFENIDDLTVRDGVFFTVEVEEEVNHFGVLARFAKAVISAIFLGDIEEFLVRREREIVVERTGREDDRGFERFRRSL